jgi:hypothetical protein
MVIGGIVIPRNQKIKISEQLQKLFKTYNFNYELKWTKARSLYKDFYKELIGTVLTNDAIRLRFIVIDKQKVDTATYHNNDEELAFFKFYYLMLRPLFTDMNKYYVLLDKKPVRDKNRAHALTHFLKTYLALHKQSCQLKHLQGIDSRENLFIQVVDFFTGLIASHANSDAGSFKRQLVDYLAEKVYFGKTSPSTEKKINVLYWQPYEK